LLAQNNLLNSFFSIPSCNIFKEKLNIFLNSIHFEKYPVYVKCAWGVRKFLSTIYFYTKILNFHSNAFPITFF
jgi:hypothetical protein